MGLLAVRGRVRMDHGILESSDLDQVPPLLAKLATKLMMPLFYPLVRDGQFPARFLQRQMEKLQQAMPEYLDAFLGMFGGVRPYVSRRSCENQFYSDLVTPLPEGISVPGTTIHVFYAEKMGRKYSARYRKHFRDPVIYPQDLRHKELLDLLRPDAGEAAEVEFLRQVLLEAAGDAHDGPPCRRRPRPPPRSRGRPSRRGA